MGKARTTAVTKKQIKPVNISKNGKYKDDNLYRMTERKIRDQPAVESSTVQHEHR